MMGSVALHHVAERDVRAVGGAEPRVERDLRAELLGTVTWSPFHVGAVSTLSSGAALGAGWLSRVREGSRPERRSDGEDQRSATAHDLPERVVGRATARA